ncbi:MAG TPA: Gfo/Idh/MocA family oxidoreductase [Thermoanaerobaculia bacterium]|nr:Gfo/Idh/MocA family oxidoreductase [Thermoanaerobaculia bacterium]
MCKIGIIGTGWGTRVQVPQFREAGLQVVAVAGFNRDKTRDIAAGLNLRAHDDWRDLVASPDIDLVTITSPPSRHREMALAALEAGKHVICEKPTALDAGEAEEMLQAARSRPGQLALIDHELRFLPAWREARERMAVIGPIRYAEVRYSSPARGGRDREWNWWSDAAQGGGILGAVGSHAADALRYFGMEFESALGFLRTTIEERPHGDATRAVTADDWASAQFRMRGGAVVSMICSAVSRGPDETSMITIHGEEGAFRFVGEEVLVSKGGAPFTRFAGGDMAKIPGNSHGGAYGTGTLHLGRALRAALDDGDRSALAPAATFEDGLAQQRVLDAVRRSSASGTWTAV